MGVSEEGLLVSYPQLVMVIKSHSSEIPHRKDMFCEGTVQYVINPGHNNDTETFSFDCLILLYRGI